MAEGLKTFLFTDYRIVTASSGRSKYAHTFGGSHDRKGTSRDDCKGKLIHLLHRFDLTDPSIPISVPGVRWLPIYYCFDFRVNDLGYRLISDEKLVTYFNPKESNVSKEESWPDDEGYPLEFPKSSIKISKYDYDPTNLEDAYNWAGVFGISQLTKQKQTVAKKRIVKHVKIFGLTVPETEEEFQDAFTSPFRQGKPNSSCMNPKCSNLTKRGQLITIALMPAEPVKGIHTFGRWGSGVLLIVEMCLKCYTIRVSNQCD